MTDTNEDVVDISTLRAVAKTLGIKAERTWKTDDYLAAIAERNLASNMPTASVLAGDAPKPGFARIMIHRNPDPSGSNSPVHVALNGKFYQIPRGIEVDIEKEFIEVLQHARSKMPVMKTKANSENPAGVYADEENVAYPFQVIAITPGGKFNNPADNRAAKHKYKVEFMEEFEHWPTDGELREFLKTRGKRA